MKIESFDTYLALHSDFKIFQIALGTVFITNNNQKWLIFGMEPRMSLYCFSTANTIDSKSNSVQLDTKDKKEVHALLTQYLENVKDENWLF